jgi:hypothetical protein
LLCINHNCYLYCCCVSIIIVICICPPGALIWLINLFYSILYMYVHLANASTVVLCYMSCIVYLFVFKCMCCYYLYRQKVLQRLMFVMLHCKPDLKNKVFYSIDLNINTYNICTFLFKA